jgi:hypothetical protein
VEVTDMVALLSVWTPHLYHQLHDWFAIVALILFFASFEFVAMIRHALWRRRVLSACR